jgi:DNA modification methylase
MLALEFADLKLEGFDFDLLGFDDDELLEFMPVEKPEPLTDEDVVPDVPVVPVTKMGDVWLCGNHRVMCGDSTSIDAVDKLMNGKKADICLCDPPYGISAVDKNSRMKQLGWTQYEGDKTIKTAIDAFNLCISICEQVVFWGANHYANDIPNSGGWLVWDKQDGKDTLTYSMGELAWTNILKNVQIFTHKWDGFRKDSEKGIARIHPSQKPIALHEWVLNKIKTQSMNVLDLFGGSGSTLIACEKTNRINYSMELDEKYCDVIVKRWQEFTGKQATLESTGKTFNDSQR